MATQQVYRAYMQQNKGTLFPGQTISVGKFTVQIERYLSQGGFAHVYLVRSATPIYNTTHHVLKRIAVENESMLTEVKQEVDIMRLLKGHPNIVHLIDAAWHRLPNGSFEVFILMEYCPGGGIIDMMNRRLRDRLTEAEILQIFVDVCEGVAYMHNSKPPLLHRDLKVENILQSSPTSFKLCDFGSAITVAARPPSTTQEIRTLQADLMHHTTLQYRAPEMVDPWLRRPIDEKSDVWALGILLYKLCYYTTPFEEHGPLAILNVQYRFPPYPAYSPQVNGLITSMLRELGTHRPSVFEILSHVHQLRGTKSSFQYTIPTAPPLSPRRSQFGTFADNGRTSSAVNGVMVYRSQHSPTNGTPSVDSRPPKNTGVQARELVLDAIAPMRRGRPIPKDAKDAKDAQETTSRQSSPQKQRHSSSKEKSKDAEKKRNWLDADFDAKGEKAWKAITATELPRNIQRNIDDAWSVGETRSQLVKKEQPQGFNDDFGQELWDSFDPKSSTSANTKVGSVTTSIIMHRAVTTPHRTPAFTGSDVPQARQPVPKFREKDAFEGLGLSVPSDKSGPTLGEARKLRTGLAVISATADVNTNSRRELPTYSSRPPSAPRPSYHIPGQSQLLSPAPPAVRPSHSGSSVLSSRPSSALPLSTPELPAESRFPSIEELDAQFAASQNLPVTKPSQSRVERPRVDIERKAVGGYLRPAQTTIVPAGARTEQVTSVAMRDPRSNSGPIVDLNDDLVVSKRTTTSRDGGRLSQFSSDASSIKMDDTASTSDSPYLKKHRSTVSLKPGSLVDVNEGSDTSAPVREGVSELSKPSPRPRVPTSRDWLTGSDDELNAAISSAFPSEPYQLPVLRESPSKRASLIEKSSIHIPEAVTPQREEAPLPLVSKSDAASSRALNVDTSHSYQDTAEALTESWSPFAESMDRKKAAESSSSADESPEDVNGFTPRPSRIIEERRKTRHKGRQSSVHDLVDLWGGGITSTHKDRERNIKGTGPAEIIERPRKELSSSHRPPHSSAASQLPGSSSPLSLLSVPLAEPRSTTQKSADTSIEQRNKQPSPGASPVTPRTRPQSMLIFPSRSQDSSGVTSAGLPSTSLSPPKETKHRATRRTSISDMVQHYEAIHEKAKVPAAGPPPVATKPMEFKAVPITERSQFLKEESHVDTQKEPAKLIPISLQVPNKSFTTGDSSEARRSPISPRASPSRTSPVGPPQKTSPTGLNRNIPAEDDSRSPGEVGPPSPDRPYQGVSKLIDQWQRKTAESNAPRGPPLIKRGGLGRGTGVATNTASRGH